MMNLNNKSRKFKTNCKICKNNSSKIKIITKIYNSKTKIYYFNKKIKKNIAQKMR